MGKLKMGKLHTVTLIVGDRTFGVTVTRNFKPEPGHANERIYYKQIYRALKMRFNEWSSRFLMPTISELWQFLEKSFCYFLERKKTEILFSSQKKFLLSKKCENFFKVLGLIAIALLWNIPNKATSRMIPI